MIMTTFMASFTTRHATIAYKRIASVCGQGKGMSPGKPTRVRLVPTSGSTIRAAIRALLGIVDQNARRSRADKTENTAKYSSIRKLKV